MPIFVAEEINDNVLPCLDPSDLIGLGVSQMTCLTILGAAHSAAKNKKLETEDVLDNVAKHQSVLERSALESIARDLQRRLRRSLATRRSEDPFAAASFQTRRGNARATNREHVSHAHREIMKDPVLCVEDGHTYERVAVEQWWPTGARTSPATSQHSSRRRSLRRRRRDPRKLIAALLEEHRG